MINGHFVDVEAGVLLPEGTELIISGNEIETIVTPDTIHSHDLPGEAFDLQGGYVIPGLINTHVHIQLVNPTLLLGGLDPLRIRRYKEDQIVKNMADCIIRGVTTIRDGLSEDLRANRLLKSQIERRLISGPRIIQAVNVTPHQGTFAPKHNVLSTLFYSLMGFPPMDYHHPDSGVVAFRQGASQQEVRDAVDIALEERGADTIKVYDQREKKLSYRPGAVIMEQKQLDALADQASRRGVNTTMHHVTVESFGRGVRAGVNGLVHLPLDGLLEKPDLDRFDASGCLIEPTLTLATYYNWEFESNQWKDHPEQKRLTALRENIRDELAEDFWLPGLQPSFEDGLRKCSRGKLRTMSVMDMSHIYRYFSGIISHGMENLRMIAGICGLDHIACGTDSGAAPAVPAAVGHELEMVNFCFEKDGEGGLFPDERLKTATINSAKVLGMETQIGSLQSGKIADLAVLDKNPLQNPEIIGGPVSAVFKDGELVYRKTGV